jgi:glycosyltransferase involved in cell wall biosynthesis
VSMSGASGATSVGEGVRVAALSAQGPLSPSFRIRGAIPARALAQQGIRVSLMPLFSAEQDQAFRIGGAWRKALTILNARRALRARLPLQVDVAWVFRQVDMLPSLGIEKLAIDDHRLVLDVDDPIWLDATSYAGGHPLAFLKGTRRKLRMLAGRAEVVVAGNAYLAEWLAQYARDVRVIPSVVDTSRSTQRRHQNSETVVLGWIGSHSSFRHLEKLLAPLARAAATVPDIRFELWSMGGGTMNIPGMRCLSIPWAEETESIFLERMDIGLMPLADDPWTRGKCAYKAIQYMSAGIPVIADNVGVSAEVIGAGHAGYLVSSSTEWTEAVVSLSRDAGMRTRFGERGRHRAIADYSLQRWLPEIVAALTGRARVGDRL